MKKPQRKKRDKKAFFYPDEFKKLLDLCSDKQKFTILLLLNTGSRINEAKHIRKEDIDTNRNTITLWVTKRRAVLKETRPNPRRIPISTKFCKYLKKNIKKYKVLSKNQTGIILKEKAKIIKTKYDSLDFSAHNLRKTFGTWMLALGVDGFKLAQHLGHAPETLRTEYASPDIFNERDKDIMREILNDLPTRLRS